mgnify:FL=1
MVVLIGYTIVFASVLGGFVMAGGHLAALLQPAEFVIIVGAALGAFITANGGAPLKAILHAIPQAFRSSSYNKALYMELFALLFELLTKVRKEGLMSIEADVDDPSNSPIFSKYPVLIADHVSIEFLCDYLRLMVGGNLNPFEIENLMDLEIETHHHEVSLPVNALAKMADALPAYGIVAAVMGVVHTMESVGNVSPAELGRLIAAALIGTFLGILISYGFVAPVAARLEHQVSDQMRVLLCIKVTLLASLNGYAPPTAVEFGRKALVSEDRPGFLELEEHLKKSRGR